MTADERHALRAWADRVRRDANQWAELAEGSRGEQRALAPHLDAIAMKARDVRNYVEALETSSPAAPGPIEREWRG